MLVEEAVAVKKMKLVTLMWALAGLILSMTGTAMASDRDDYVPETVRTGREFHAWEEGYEITEYVPPPRYYQPYPHHYPDPVVVPIPRDVRVLIAQRERLKIDYHYYSLSHYPGNQARAEQIAQMLNDVEARIEAWRIGYR